MSTQTEEYIDNNVEQTARVVNFEMVTFSLGGKDYGVDIMKVKEIAKADRFTLVPNAPQFVRGVYNLRGEIITIIDLRTMLNLEIERDATPMENIIILKLKDYIIGIIVDSINRVLRINAQDIKPPHPLFQEVNVKYLEGIVENEKQLYLLLDVESLLGKEEQRKAEFGQLAESVAEQVDDKVTHYSKKKDLKLDFIIETLRTFKSFYVSELNLNWVEARFQECKKLNKNDVIQLKNDVEAEEFLATFFSHSSGELWKEPYITNFNGLLPDKCGSSFLVWNPGCQTGHETYSMACLLRLKYPQAQIKIWANDRDLLTISMAPNLVVAPSEVAPSWKEFTLAKNDALQFASQIKDLIIFEYHDIRNRNQYPPLDLILARDILSFVNLEDQKRLMVEFHDNLKEEGVLVLGDNEKIDSQGWGLFSQGETLAYRKINVIK